MFEYYESFHEHIKTTACISRVYSGEFQVQRNPGWGREDDAIRITH